VRQGKTNSRRSKTRTREQPKISGRSNKKPPFTSFTLEDLLKDKHLEIVAAALLLSGKLKVDAVTLFRNSPVIQVNLLGQFLANGNGNGNDKSNALADFLQENGDMTLDDIVDAFQKRMKSKKGR